MKIKFIFVVLMALCIQDAYSQIKFEESYNNELIIIGNISSGAAFNALVGTPTVQAPEHRLYCRMFGNKVTYGILVSTSNRFDDTFEFALGKDISTAKESIESILSFVRNSDKGKSINVVDEDNRKIQLTYHRSKSITMKVLEGNGEIVCDNVCLTVKNLERALLLLETKAENKVAKAIAKNKEKDETAF